MRKGCVNLALAFVLVAVAATASSFAQSGTSKKQINISEITPEALKRIDKLAHKGNVQAQTALGLAYGFGVVVERNDIEAMRWFEKAAREDEFAQYSLGVMYHEGRGTAVDHVQARKWFLKAAHQGKVRAQFNLAVLFYNGQGGPRDFPSAAKWFEISARQGDIKAQTNLASMYERGVGVPMDADEAMKWLRKPAESGFSDAQRSLGELLTQHPLPAGKIDGRSIGIKLCEQWLHHRLVDYHQQRDQSQDN